MSVAPFAGVVALDNFKSPTAGEDGIQGQVPKPLAGQLDYVLTANGWASVGGGTVTSVTATAPVTSSGGTAPNIALTTSGANSVVIRDANQNVSANAFDDAYVNIAASGTQIVLTASSARRYTFTGSGGQVVKLPDATTLVNGAIFEFDNNQSSGAITVNNNSNTLIVSVPSGGITRVDLLSNSIAAGSWDKHDFTPSNVSWSTNTLDYAGSITSATWNGTAVAINRGGTGQTTANAAFNALAPSQTGNSGKYLTTDGSNTSWATNPLGTVTSVDTAGTVNGLTLTGGPITTSGTITLGGTLDLSSPPAIGGTTPSTGTFTTLTAQTEVLKGTGQNLVTYSNTFSSWTNTAQTLTGSQSDPFGGSTATLIVPTTASANHAIYSNAPFIANFPYTLSIYAKASGYSLVYISDAGGGTYGCSFNLSTLAVTPFTGCTGTITAVSGATGWYRLTLTTTVVASTNSRFTVTGYPAGAAFSGFYANFTGDGTSGIVIYGAQAEFGSTANAYQATTTTAVYGTPSLSFSGVAGLGLQSDGSLYVSPAGTGALQAQATTSSATGGNARGANAVDWQTSRNAASQVANGQYAVIGGGYRNTSSNFCSVIAGGESNTVSGYSAVLSGGTSATVSGTYAFGGGGYLNTTSGNNSAVVSGYGNTSSGFYNFVGTGYANSGTSTSAVTTQSGTMNGTTAVTLSGSNASIKVGQLVTGTSISNFPHTYVAAISGTSLTLSQNASGSSTNTINFYTPHGVVVGGGNNQATGSYSFIGGGGDAGTAANRNVASGIWSTVVGGAKNTASQDATFVGGGYGNTASGYGAVICGGGLYGTIQNTQFAANIASGSGSFIGGGFGNQASGYGSTVSGGQSNVANANWTTALGALATTRSIVNNFAVGAYPISQASGLSQTAILILGKETTNATATVITSDGGAASGTNQVILPNNSAYYFRGEIIAGVTGAGDTKGWYVEGVIKRGAGVGTTALVGTPTVSSLYADVGAATWAVTALADTTNGGLKITVTGQASTTIRWVCQLTTTEMTF